MPSHDCLRLDNDDGTQNSRPYPMEPDERQTIEISKQHLPRCHATYHTYHSELMPKHQILSLELPA
jgi:hypothetical protein